MSRTSSLLGNCHYVRRMSLLPRWSHRLWAKALGYFWLPCPLCRRYSGGHEWRDIGGKSSAIPDWDGSTNQVGICPACTRAGLGE